MIQSEVAILKVRRFFVCVGGFLLTCAAGAWSIESATETTQLRHHISGENRLEYRFRYWDGDRDSDLYDYWYLRGRDLFDGQFDAYFSGRLHKDLDGTTNSLAEDPFVSVEDLDDGWEDQIYQLYGDIHDRRSLYGVRFGRMYVEDADWLHIDGVEARIFKKGKIGGSVFIGQPVSYYTSDSDDWAGGVSITGRPWYGNRSRFTYVRYEDDRAEHDDDWYALDVWQYLNAELRTRGRLSMLDDDFQTGLLELMYLPLEGDFDAFVGVSYWGGLEQHSREYSPLYSVLGELEPYWYVWGRVTKLITPWFSVSPGAAGRLVEGNNRDVGNRQYGHYDLTLIFQPDPHWTISAAAEYWDVSGSDEFWGLTGEVEYQPNRNWRVALGTAYAEYEYHRHSDYTYTVVNGDIYGDVAGSTTRITPDVYTVYARAKVKLTDIAWFDIRGEIEDNNIESDVAYELRTILEVRFQ